MPTYNFKHNETGEVIELFLKLSEREDWLKNNPDWSTTILSAPGVTSGNTSALKMAGDGWKEVQNRVKSGLPPKFKDKIRTK